jgi:hypothetical protein
MVMTTSNKTTVAQKKVSHDSKIDTIHFLGKILILVLFFSELK